MSAQDIIDDARVYASSSLEGADAFIQALRDAATFGFAGTASGIIVPWVPSGDYLHGFSVSGAPAVSAPAVSATSPGGVDVPGAAPEASVRDLVDVVVPDFTGVLPELNFPVVPSNALPSAPGAAPEFSAPAIPDRPTVSLPAVPVLADIAIPDAPSIEIPLFDTAAPLTEVDPPTERFVWAEAAYSSDLLDRATALLESDIENGGYGLDPRDEQRLWERERDRQLRNAEADIGELDRQMSSRGFSMPTGTHRAALATASQRAGEALSAASRDIAMKRADLYVQNRQFAITTGLNAEQFLIQYHAGMAERSLNAAKYLVDAGIALFNTQVEAANLRLRAYQTAAQVFETRVRAALANAEVFKTQIEAASLRVQVNRETIDLYRSQLDGVKALIDIYRTEMEAANVSAQIERIRLEAFREQVGAYAAQVRAKSDEFGMYEAAIRGEVARVDAFKSQVQAYGSQVDAARTRLSIGQEQVRTDIERGRLALETHQQNIVRYREVLSGTVQAAKILLEKQGVDVDVWARQNNLTAEREKLSLEAWRASKAHQNNQYSYYISWAKTMLEALANEAQLKVKAADSGVSIYSNIAAGAMSSLNMLASIAE